MNRKQIECFAKRFFQHPVKIFYLNDLNDDSDGKYLASAHYCYKDNDYQIHFNRDCLRKRYCRVNKARFLKGCILHEIGHFVIGDVKPRSKRELNTHLWAIDTAERFGMLSIERSLIKQFKAWEDYEWNGPYRVYKMAYRLSLKNKKLAKKYGLIN